MPEPHLVLERLAARDRGRLLLDGVSLRLARGQTLALLGPSGAGKTAMLLVLAGFLRPSLGTIRLAGRDITVAPPQARDIGMAFDGDMLFPHMSVLDNVAFGAKMRGIGRTERRAQAAATLSALQLGRLSDLPPARLAPLERRLVALARAAAARPALLLIDEPSGPQDTALREAVRHALAAAVAGDQTTAILATADRAAAFGVADQVALLRDGRIEQLGTPQRVYEQPANRFVAGFTGGCNLLPTTLLHERDGQAVIGFTARTASARCPPGMLPGTATLCVRPHRMRIDPAGPLSGRVEQLAYEGAVTRVGLRVGESICVAELTQAPAGLARGTTLAMGWDAADAWLLPDQGIR